MVTDLVIDNTVIPATGFRPFGGSRHNVCRSLDPARVELDFRAGEQASVYSFRPHLPSHNPNYSTSARNRHLTSEMRGPLGANAGRPASLVASFFGGRRLIAPPRAGLYRASAESTELRLVGSNADALSSSYLARRTERLDGYGIVWIFPNTCHQTITTPANKRGELRTLGGPVTIGP